MRFSKIRFNVTNALRPINGAERFIKNLS